MENEKDERRRNGIFLGIVGVATLIVAIIGASFAYFSAQAASANSAIDIQAYEFNASLSMQELYQSDKGLIPVDPTGTIQNATAPNNTNLAYALNVAKKCEDDHNLRICALYEVTITNGGSAALNLNGSIVTTANNASTRSGATAFQNLQYRDVTASGEGENRTYTIGSTATPLATTVGGSINIGTITVNPGTPVKKYILIYLNELMESNEPQDQSNEMGATFQGQVVYASEGANTNRLTGTFTVSGS